MANVNELMIAWRQPPFSTLSELYARVDETILTTFPELDHFQPPRNKEYWGVLPSIGGAQPCWPDGEGKRVFIYLKPNPHLPELLAGLARMELPTLVFISGISAATCARHSKASLRVVAESQDIVQVARQCDVAISHGGHGMLVETLLAGKPSLILPQSLEQRLIARNVQRLDAGLDAKPNQPQTALACLDTLLQDPKFTRGASRFATQYQGFDTDAVRMRSSHASRKCCGDRSLISRSGRRFPHSHQPRRR